MTIDIQRGKVIEVARRRARRSIPGQGMIDAMVVIWKHWQKAFRKNENFSQIHGVFTVEYPEERIKLPEPYRNMPILLYDDETGHELCTGCYQCARICPPQVIHITQAKDPVTGKMVPAATEFVIEYDACMSCGFCAEVCPFDSIKMDHVFELSTADHPKLTVHKAELNRPISYYASIAPTMWAEVKDQALKKLQGNIKRRPDVIGMVPTLTDKIEARRRDLAAAAAAAPPAAAPAAAAPAAAGGKLSPEEKAAKLAAMRAAKAGGDAAPAATPAAAEPAPAPAATGGKLSPEEKAAKLAAIRAAKQAGAAPAAEPEPVSAPPTDDKAARLAAIRAKNATKQGDAASTAEPEPASAPPTNDKAAKLAAIRAANAAKQAATEAPAAPAESPAGNGAASAESSAGNGNGAPPADDKAAKLAAIRAANAAKKARETDG